MTTESTRQRLLEVLANHIGRENGITAADLVTEMHGESGAALEREMRVAVQQLREEGHHICAHPSSGYYLAANPQELDDTCRFLVDRAMCSLKQVAHMKRVSVPDLHGQMRLTT